MWKFIVGVISFHVTWAQATLVYKPERFDPGTARVVVAFHGCRQSAEAMAYGTGWNKIADQENLLILYPQLPQSDQDLGSWKYWDPANQTPESGQMLELRDEIEFWKNEFHVGKAPVFLTGLGSGATTVAGLLSCFPNDFAAGAIHSGMSYGIVSNFEDALRVQVKGAKTVLRTGYAGNPRNFTGRLMVLHGTSDRLFAPSHTERILRDFLGEPRQLSPRTTKHVDNGLKYEVTDYTVHGHVRGRLVLFHRLPHAWPGFEQNLRIDLQTKEDPLGRLLRRSGGFTRPELPYFHPRGPSATNLIWDWFSHTVSAQCDATF